MTELKVPKGATKQKRIIGRGNGSKRGGTSGKGHNGQNARSGGGVRPGFEGGQMPLYRRIAVRGFSNHPFKIEYIVVNLESINGKFADGETVNETTLKEKGLIKGKNPLVKILGVGTLDKKLTFEIKKISKSAREKIEKAGGTIVSEKSGKEEGEDGK